MEYKNLFIYGCLFGAFFAVLNLLSYIQERTVDQLKLCKGCLDRTIRILDSVQSLSELLSIFLDLISFYWSIYDPCRRIRIGFCWTLAFVGIRPYLYQFDAFRFPTKSDRNSVSKIPANFDKKLSDV